MSEGADLSGFEHLMSDPKELNIEEHVSDASTQSQSCHVLISNIRTPFAKVFSFSHYNVLMIVP